MSDQLNKWHLLRYLKFMIIYYLKPTTFGFWNEQRDKENIPEKVKALSNFMLPLHRHCEHTSWAMREFREIQVDRQGLSV